MTFDQIGLDDRILKALVSLGFETPTEIQSKTIPVLVEKDVDLIALARTGTGKTAAFGLPLLQKIDTDVRSVQSLVLAPTRELCVQIGKDLKTYAQYLPSVNIVEVYGGASITKQRDDLRRGAQIVVATPGRLIDMVDRRYLDLSQIQTIVLDEADEMLNMGFMEDVKRILSMLPETRKTWLFSATMPNEIRRLTSTFMVEPEQIKGAMGPQETTISHSAVLVDGRHRSQVLKRLLDSYPEIYGIVFCRTRAETQQLAESLMKEGYSAQALHGDLSQQQRDWVMNAFRSKHVRMLIATDVAARGIDVQNITHVIHYHLPDEPEAFTHRSGRTGRAGKSGISIAIVARNEMGKFNRIRKNLGLDIKEMQIPTPAEVCQKQMAHQVEVISKEPKEIAIIDELIDSVMEPLADISKEDIVKRMMALSIGDMLLGYEKIRMNPDTFNSSSPRRNESGKSFDSDDSYGGRKDEIALKINVGKKDGFDWMDLKDALRETGGLGRNEIGNVQVSFDSSTFKVPSDRKEDFIQKMAALEFEGKKVVIEEDTSGRGGRGGYSSRPPDDRKKFRSKPPRR